MHVFGFSICENNTQILFIHYELVIVTYESSGTDRIHFCDLMEEFQMGRFNWI